MGDQLEQKGSLRVSEESPATSLWQAGQSETYSDGPCHSPACPRLKQVSAVATGAGCWNVGFGEQIWGEDHCWLWGDSLRGWEWGAAQQGMFIEEAFTEAKHCCWVTCKGWDHHCSPFSHVHAPASMGTREGPCWSWLVHPCHHLLHPPPNPRWHTHPHCHLTCSHVRWHPPAWVACWPRLPPQLLPAWWAHVEQTPVGGTQAEVGLKPHLSPRGCVIKEKVLKSLLVQCKPSSYTSADGFLN